MDVDRWVAVRSAGNRRDLARRLADARDALVTGVAPDALGLRSVIERSWRRCATEADLGSDVPPRAFAADEADERFAASPLTLAMPVLRGLLGALDPADHELIIVTDAEGTVIWTDGTPTAIGSGEAVGVIPGARWSEAVSGTNGMGTALAERHPVQIFAAEHLRPGVERWVCNAAPVRDPETGQPLGVVDLSGAFGSAHPHSLLAVISVARTIEQLLAEQLEVRWEAVRDVWASRLRRSGPVALASPLGTIIAAATPEWTGRRLDAVPAEGGTMSFEDTTVTAEPIDGGFVLWEANKNRPLRPAASQPLRLEALGRDRARIKVGGETLELSRRHSEILMLLTLHPRGLSDEQVALKVYGERGRPVTARAEVSRLRRVVGTNVTSAPYRLAVALASDIRELEDAMRAQRIAEALDRYPGPLLPRSECSEIVELRERIEHGLRAAVLKLDEPEILLRWLEHPAGEDDIVACRRLAVLLDADDPRRAAVLSRLRRLSQPVRGQRHTT